MIRFPVVALFTYSLAFFLIRNEVIFFRSGKTLWQTLLSRFAQTISTKNMYTQNQFSCFLIGEGTLPIQYAEFLLERGHEILGVISSA